MFSRRPGSGVQGYELSRNIKRSAETSPRVLHVVETWLPVPSGYTSRGWNIVTAQANLEGSEPYVLTSSRQIHLSGGDVDTPAGFDRFGVRVAQASVCEQRGRWLRPGYIQVAGLAKVIIESCSDLQIDIIHCHWSSGIGSAARRAAERLGIPFIAEVRFDLAGAVMSETIDRRVPGLEHLLRLRFERHLLGADAVVAASHSLARLIAKSQPLLRAPIVTMPNAVDCHRFQPAPDTSGQRRELGIAKGDFVIGSTTNMLRYEGLDVLLDAVERLRDRLPALHLVLVGTGTQHAWLAGEVARRGLPVTFTDQVPADDIPSYLAMFDLFVVPRRDAAITRFASPIKLVEAMASGLACVGSALGDIVDLLADDRGLTVRPDDAACLAKSIAYLAEHPERRQALGANARVWIEAQPDWRALAADYNALYSDVLTQRRL